MHAVGNCVPCVTIVDAIEHDISVFDEWAWSTSDCWTRALVARPRAAHNIESGGGEDGEVGDRQCRIVGLDDQAERPAQMVPSGVQHVCIAPRERLRR